MTVLSNVSSLKYSFFNNKGPAYINDVFKPTGHPNTNNRIFSQIKSTFMDIYGQKTFLYIAPICVYSKWRPSYLQTKSEKAFFGQT